VCRRVPESRRGSRHRFLRPPDTIPQEFDGEDTLLPLVRQVLNKTRQDLIALQPLPGFMDVEAELPGPDEERVAELRERLLR
jgi:hypothetical protein